MAKCEHLSFAIFANFDLKNPAEMAFDQDLTCLIFPFRWACFSIKIGRNAQWVHLLSMDFDDFLSIYLTFYSKSPFLTIKVSLSGNTTYHR